MAGFPLPRTVVACKSPNAARILRGRCGEIGRTLRDGRDPRARRWCCPLLEARGGLAHQEFTPVVRRWLAFTLSASAASSRRGSAGLRRE